MAEAQASHDEVGEAHALACQGFTLALQGDAAAARAAAELGGLTAGVGYWALAVAALAAGDATTAQDPSEAAWQHWSALA